MKKTLSILAVIGMTATAASSVVACGSSNRSSSKNNFIDHIISNDDISITKQSDDYLMTFKFEYNVPAGAQFDEDADGTYTIEQLWTDPISNNEGYVHSFELLDAPYNFVSAKDKVNSEDANSSNSNRFLNIIKNTQFFTKQDIKNKLVKTDDSYYLNEDFKMNLFCSLYLKDYMSEKEEEKVSWTLAIVNRHAVDEKNTLDVLNKLYSIKVNLPVYKNNN